MQRKLRPDRKARLPPRQTQPRKPPPLPAWWALAHVSHALHDAGVSSLDTQRWDGGFGSADAPVQSSTSKRGSSAICCGLQGAEAALHAIARLFGGKMLAAVPRAWVQASAALLQRPPEAPLDSPPTADPQVCLRSTSIVDSPFIVF